MNIQDKGKRRQYMLVVYSSTADLLTRCQRWRTKRMMEVEAGYKISINKVIEYLLRGIENFKIVYKYIR